jgi:protein TonB
MSRPAVVPEFRVPKARAERGRWAFVSVLLHSLLVLLIVGAETGFFENVFGTGGGPGPAGGGGGGGAERITYVELPTYEPTALAAPRPSATEQLRFNPEQPSVRQIPLPELRLNLQRPTQTIARVSAVGSDRGTGGGPGRGPGSGGGRGTGLGTGIGSHVGPGTGDNQPYVYAPEPRSITFPIVTVPRQLRGQELTIHFWVDARGRVTKVEVEPPIRDRAYRDALRETLLGWSFYPARTASGAAVAGEMEITHIP